MLRFLVVAWCEHAAATVSGAWQNARCAKGMAVFFACAHARREELPDLGSEGEISDDMHGRVDEDRDAAPRRLLREPAWQARALREVHHPSEGAHRRHSQRGSRTTSRAVWHARLYVERLGLTVDAIR